MALDYSIIQGPSLGLEPHSYDVGSAITEYVRSVPIGQQVTVSVTNLTSGVVTPLQEGTDYYTGAEGEILVDRSLVPAGARISFSLNTDFENFYDDFADLGAAPAGPVKRRTQQLQNMALQLRDRIETIESGDIDVDFTETSIIAGNNTYGPGSFQIDTANGVTFTDVAGTGFRIGLNYGTIFADSIVVGLINDATQAYIEANPPASGVVTVSGRSPDGVGNIDLLIADVSDAATVATSGAYSDLSGTPQDLSSFNNDLGFIGTTDVTNIYNAINEKLDEDVFTGGTSGQVWKKLSNTEGDYGWGTDSGGAGGGATQLDQLDDVELPNPLNNNQALIYDGSDFINQAITASIISDFQTATDARVAAVGFDGDYNSLSNTPTLRTDSEVRTLADEQITAYVAANPVLPLINDNAADIATNAGNIATNTTNITNNANAIAGKLDTPSGTPNTGDVIEWDGSQAAWAAPSGGSGGGARIWSSYFDRSTANTDQAGFNYSASWSADFLADESDEIIDQFASDQITVGTSIGSYSNGEFSIAETGTYKVSWSISVATENFGGAEGKSMDVALLRNAGGAPSAADEVLRRSLLQFVQDDLAGSDPEDNAYNQFSHSSLINLSAGDGIFLWLSSASSGSKNAPVIGSWIIEKVG